MRIAQVHMNEALSASLFYNSPLREHLFIFLLTKNIYSDII